MPTRRLVLMSPLSLGVGSLILRTGKAGTPWRMATEYPATSMPGEGVSHFARIVSHLSNGALSVQPGFDAPGGLRSAAMPRAVAEGWLEAADAFTGGLASEAPIFELSALPFLTASMADTARLLRVARSSYEAVLTARGLVLLYATPWPPTGLWSHVPLPGPEALQGLRVRTYDAAGTAVLRAAGAVPVQISFADALPRLRAGDVDAVLSSGDGGAGARLWEVLPYFTAINYASPLSLAFCSGTALALLPEPVRATVQQVARETEARQFKAMTTRQAENELRMRANGVTIATAPALRAALARAGEPVVADWTVRAGGEGDAILAAFRQR